MPPTEQHNHTVYQEIDNITHKFYLALLHIQRLSSIICTMDHHHIVIFDRFHRNGHDSHFQSHQQKESFLQHVFPSSPINTGIFPS